MYSMQWVWEGMHVMHSRYGALTYTAPVHVPHECKHTLTPSYIHGHTHAHTLPTHAHTHTLVSVGVVAEQEFFL